MALTGPQKQQCIAEVLAGDPGEPYNLSRPDTTAALDATDAWIQANQAAFNAALPVAARNTLTLAQKNLLFAAVCKRRAGF